MWIVINSIVPVFLALMTGLFIGRYYQAVSINLLSRLCDGCLYILLLFMGITIGSLSNIANEIMLIGIKALIFASAIAISIIVLFFLDKDRTQKPMASSIISKQPKLTFNLLGYIKEPGKLIMIIFIGFLIGYHGIMPAIDFTIIVNLFLYAMLFFIGIKLSRSHFSFRRLLLNKTGIKIVFYSLIGTYIAALFVGYCFDMPIKDALAVTSGFGWYSLSAVLLTKMNEPLLASLAFFCDLFREIIALLLIPLFARLNKSDVVISIAGSTGMDVALPMIEKYCGVSSVPVALIVGGIMTLLVPLLIPFFYYL